MLCEIADSVRDTDGECELYRTISDTTGHPVTLGIRHWHSSRDDKYHWLVSVDSSGSTHSYNLDCNVSCYIKDLFTADACKIKIGDELYRYWDICWVNNSTHPYFGFLIDRRNGSLLWGNSTLGQFLGLED